MLIAAISGRALAEAASRSGFAPLVADAFADSDTRAAALAVETIGWDLREEVVLPALERLSAGRAPRGFVYGAGFEDKPSLLEAIARRWPLAGNSPEAIRRLKTPPQFAELCKELDIAHPETSNRPRKGWLTKKKGGAGGGHISASPPADLADRYYQRRVSGEPVSALFLSDGQRMQIVGFSRQWASPTDKSPWRYGGAVRPVAIPEVEGELATAIAKIVPRAGIKGLNSADFIVSKRAAKNGRRPWWLIEINPRPGATLDIFQHDRLFSAHVAACAGELPLEPFHFNDSSAAAVVYAERNIASVPPIVWPDWASDRQEAGTSVAAGEPLCTVRAEARTAAAARSLVRRREASIRAKLEADPA